MDAKTWRRSRLWRFGNAAFDEQALTRLAEEGHLQSGTTVVIIGAISVGTEIVDAVQMRVVP